MIGLVGFGGEGKSSLARQWVNHLLNQPGATLRRDHVFWWAFHEPYSVEIFFEEALKFLSHGQIDPRKYPNATQQVKLIVDALVRRPQRAILVLDGFELMQVQDGDHDGTIRNHDLRELLERIADSEHRSLVLVTSRIPLSDLARLPSYHPIDVNRLNAEEGRALLRKLGVNGDDRALNPIVSQWDGHALALTLLGKYLAETQGGDASRGGVIPPLPPLGDETRYERAERVLRWYEHTLSDTQRAFLKIFSAFRLPVPDSALEHVFRLDTNDHSPYAVIANEVKQSPSGSVEIASQTTLAMTPLRNVNNQDAINAPLVQLDQSALEKLVKQLLDRRVVHRSEAQHFSVHALIRTHYRDLLTHSDPVQVQQLHSTIKAYYLTRADSISPNPTLEELNPAIEAVHHACRAGEYQAAFQICDERIYQGIEKRRLIARALGAYETILAILSEFFPDGDWSRPQADPLLADAPSKSWVLNELGLALMLVGRTGEAMPFFERSRAIEQALENWAEVCVRYRNAMDLNFILGNLAACEADAAQSLAFARQANDPKEMLKSLVNYAWVLSMRGDSATAQSLFAEAEDLQRALDPAVPYLNGLLGIRQSEHLLRTGQRAYAREVAEHNRRACELNGWLPYQSQCRSGLGELDAHAGRFDSALDHYDAAVELSTTISHRYAYAEALTARGAFRARYLRDAAAARSDLDEALNVTRQIHYHINEPYIHLGVAWAHLAVGDLASARAEAMRTRQVSEAMGFFWGQREAEAVLNKIDAV